MSKLESPYDSTKRLFSVKKSIDIVRKTNTRCVTSLYKDYNNFKKGNLPIKEDDTIHKKSKFTDEDKEYILKLYKKERHLSLRKGSKKFFEERHKKMCP